MTDEEIQALPTAELDALISRLGRVRVQRPEHQPSEPGTIEWTIEDPAWRSVQAPNGYSVIALRHNAFGWVAFALPPHERASVACLWLRHQIVPLPPPANTAKAPTPQPEPGRGGGTLH